jgi:hypothetical protein
MSEALELVVLGGANEPSLTVFARRGADVVVDAVAARDLAGFAQFRQRIESALLGGAAKRPTYGELKAYGESLFQWLVAGTVAQLYARMPAGPMSVSILSNRADVQALPWEYLQEPTQPPGPRRERSVVRVVPTVGLQGDLPLALGRKVRVLLACAAPLGQGSVSWADVRDSIERAFSARLPDGLSLDVIEATDRKSLAIQLDKVAYDVVHFSCHGEVVNGQGRLLLMDSKTKKSSPVSAVELATLLGGRKLRLVVLSACDTASGNFQARFDVMAEALVRRGIPAVIANQLPVPNSSVAAFVGDVYEELLKSGDVDQAVNAGRVGLAFELGTPNQAPLEWGIPTLYRRVDSAEIFKP